MPEDDPMRSQYKTLTDGERNRMENIKYLGKQLFVAIDNLGGTRETALAKTKVEEAVMWAVKHITN